MGDELGETPPLRDGTNLGVDDVRRPASDGAKVAMEGWGADEGGEKEAREDSMDALGTGV